MAQPLITQFYNKRKRPAEGFTTDLKSKVLILDGEVKSCTEHSSSSVEVELSGETRKITYQLKKEESVKETCIASCITSATPARIENLNKSVPRIAKKMSARTKNIIVPQSTKSDIRLAFKPKVLNTYDSPEETSGVLETRNDCSNEEKSNDIKKSLSASGNRVSFELLGGLSPKKNERKDEDCPMKNVPINGNDVAIKNARRELGLMTPKKIIEQKSKAVCLEEIRNKLNRSSRLAEIRESIKKFSESDQILKDIELQRKRLECTSPQLKKFTSIDLEVPVSPQKISTSTCVGSPNKSPLKKTPVKSLFTSPIKSPQSPAHLVQPPLALPYSYRMLAEIFRCMDTVTSMMYNRKETVTFDKLKSGVQQMLRRNFTEQHVGQIKTVFPNAFDFSQEKVSTIRSSKKETKYQLVFLPIIDSEKSDVQRIKNGSSHSVMTPSVLVERREQFHKKLLEIVKDHHEKFLKDSSKMKGVTRDNIKRWHPDFDLERVPPVTPATLPSTPNEEKTCSAQDVLVRAKTLFGCNQRMEKALQMVSEQMSKSKEILASNGTSNKSDSNSSLLKGIPPALLEKVRAKQAAKALLAMTRTPAEDREAIQFLRLPEIARIMRNIFVAEKKSVLPLETALEKLSNSYREPLSSGELEQHIRLLMKVVPGWVEILHVRKADYLRVAKDADMSLVMRKLERLVEEKKG